MNKQELSGKHVYVRFDDDGIYATDKDDIYNESSLMTTKKRGVKNAREEIRETWNGDLTKFDDIWNILTKHVKGNHYRCAMD